MAVLYFGIQPTYEELKPCSGSSLSMIRICIQPTYEELKPHVNRFVRHFASCIQPTYEELKHDPLYLIERELDKVSSLPMRN